METATLAAETKNSIPATTTIVHPEYVAQDQPDHTGYWWWCRSLNASWRAVKVKFTPAGLRPYIKDERNMADIPCPVTDLSGEWVFLLALQPASV